MNRIEGAGFFPRAGRKSCRLAALGPLLVALLAIPLQARPVSPEVAAALAMARKGSRNEALARLERLVEAEASGGEARLELGRLLLAAGRRDPAQAHFLALVEAYNRDRPQDSASMTWAGAAGAYTGSAMEAIRVLELAEKSDPRNARAFLESGRLFALKYQTEDAKRELKRAIAVDADDPESWTWLARAHFEDHEFQEMRAAAARALELDPDRYEARLLIARVLMLEDDIGGQAAAEIDRALAVNPADAEALSLGAALAYLANDRERFEEAVRRALASNPLYAGAYGEAAEMLARKRRTEEAEAMFGRALGVDPTDVDALDGLGRLMLREGREAEGRALLEDASRLDPFRVPVVNLLLTLDYMDDEFRYAAAGDVLLRLHPWRDAALLEQLPAMVGRAFSQLTATPGFSGPGARPTSPTVEVFPEHRWFAARISGIPWNGPVGACFGRLVVLDSPRHVPELSWQRVVTHELAHAFHLALTSSRVPHWFTEGLATYQEAPSRPLSWDGLLVRALRMDDFIPLLELNRGFISPRVPGEQMQAYAQAELAVEWIVDRYGPQAPVRLLRQFATGAGTEEAIRSALGIEPEQLARDLDRHWRETAKAIPLEPDYRATDVTELERRKQVGGSTGAAVELARAYLQFGLLEPAEREVRELLAADRDHAEAQMLAGRLLLARGKAPRALRVLERARKADPESLPARLLLAAALLETGEPAKARTVAREVTRRYPRFQDAWTILLEALRKENDAEGELRALEELARLDDGHIRSRLALARAARTRGDAEQAGGWLREAERIDPTDPELLALQAEIHESAGRSAEARRCYRDLLGAGLLVSFDRTPPSSTVAALERLAGQGRGARPQGAVDLLGLVESKESRAALQRLAAAPDEELRHRAAIALARRGEGTAMGELIDALDCNDCAPEAAEALGGLTARSPERERAGWERWYSTRRDGGPKAWVDEALLEAKYPIAGLEGRQRLAVLLVALEDPRWYIRKGAHLRLMEETKKGFGRGAYAGPRSEDPPLARARREAFERWKYWMKTGK